MCRLQKTMLFLRLVRKPGGKRGGAAAVALEVSEELFIARLKSGQTGFDSSYFPLSVLGRPTGLAKRSFEAKLFPIPAFVKVSGCLGTACVWAIYVFQMNLERTLLFWGLGWCWAHFQGGQGLVSGTARCAWSLLAEFCPAFWGHFSSGE